ncbi:MULTISPECIES: SDR family oxidoreductase [Streptomyces]
MGHTDRPTDIARTVPFAAGDLAAFVTGTVLVVDGGDLAS